jgi:hypothetical protein
MLQLGVKPQVKCNKEVKACNADTIWSPQPASLLYGGVVVFPPGFDGGTIPGFDGRFVPGLEGI